MAEASWTCSRKTRRCASPNGGWPMARRRSAVSSPTSGRPSSRSPIITRSSTGSSPAATPLSARAPATASTRMARGGPVCLSGLRAGGATYSRSGTGRSSAASSTSIPTTRDRTPRVIRGWQAGSRRVLGGAGLDPVQDLLGCRAQLAELVRAQGVDHELADLLHVSGCAGGEQLQPSLGEDGIGVPAVGGVGFPADEAARLQALYQVRQPGQ